MGYALAATVWLGVIAWLGKVMSAPWNWKREVKKFAEAVGLHFVPDGPSDLAGASGSINRFRVEVHRPSGRSWTGRLREVYVNVTVDHLDPRITARLEPTNVLMRRFTKDDVEIDDPGFDDLVFIDGPEALVLSYLNPTTRRLLRRSLALGVRIQNGQVVYIESNGSVRAEKLQQGLLFALELARCFSREDTVEQRLRDLVRAESNQAIRLRFFDTLTAHYLRTPETTDAARFLLTQGGDDLGRITACEMLGEEAGPIAQELLNNPAVSLEIRERALTMIVRRTPAHFVQQVLREVVAHTDDLFLDPLLLAAQTTEHWELIPMLQAVLGRSRVKLLRAEPDYLLAVRPEGAEERLITLLGHTDKTVVINAADALALIGTGSAVPSLRKRLDRRISLTEVGQACEGAIRRIQGRIHDGDGHLSLMDTRQTGRLSKMEERAGRLTHLGTGEEMEGNE